MATLSPEQQNVLATNTGGPSILPPLPGKGIKKPENAPLYRSTYRQGQAFQAILPSLMSTLFGSINSNIPQLAQQQLSLMQMLGPGFAQAESVANLAGQKAKAEGDLGLLQGTGRDITSASLDLAKLADPEFYALREKLGAKGQALLDAQDPTKLTGSEEAQVERGVNRNNVSRGVANSGSIINTVRSGMLFGDALAQKQSRLGATLNSIGAMAPALKGGTFDYNQATGQQGAGAGLGEFSSTTGNASSLGSNLASNILGQTGAAGQGRANNATMANINKTAGYEKVLGALPDY